MPKVSLIVPIYNTQEYLEECICSIQAQTFSDYEVILVDDGSTDESSLICDKYSDIDQRFIVIHKENEGVSVARNVALDVASGEYIGFVDSDDTLEPNMLSDYMELINKYGPDLVHSIGPVNLRTTEDSGNLYFYNKNNAMTEFYHGSKIRGSLWLGLFKKETIGDLRFPKDINHWEDYAFIAVFLSNASQIIVIDKRYYNYREREGSLTQNPLNDKQMSSLKIHDFLLNNNAIRDKQDDYDVKAMFIAGVFRTYVLNGPFCEYKKTIEDCIKNNIKSILFSRSIQYSRKITMLLFLFSEGLTLYLSKRYHRYILNKYQKA